ncbi:trypsin-like peptidase domain-containing protein [Thermaurantiacus sp.]
MTTARILGIALAGLGAGVALAYVAFPDGKPVPGLSPALTAPPPEPSAREARAPRSSSEISLSFAPVARAAQPAVVNIFTAKVVRERARMGPFFALYEGQPRVENSLGSGVIIDSSGYIITNNHVIAGADQIIVALADRREYPARLLFADARMDLALLKVEPGAEPLPTLKLGDSDRAEVGDLVLAIGNPFGVGQTVTQGIISAVARSGLGISDTQFFIQTDAAINQGNSGGALVNLDGELIGVNTAILTAGREGGSIGLGFAIPANMVRVFLRAAETGRLVTAWLGADGEAVTLETARAAGLDRPRGVLMTGVTPGSPAARAGLRPGDIILSVDGKDVADPAALRYRIATLGVNQTVRVGILRDRRPTEIRLQLVAPPEVPPRQLTRLPQGSILAGVAIANLSPALAQELGAGLPERGVVVVEVPANAPARVTGFPRPGDVLEAVNGQPVASVTDVGRLISSSPAQTLLRLNRSGQRADCLFQAPARWGCRAA